MSKVKLRNFFLSVIVKVLLTEKITIWSEINFKFVGYSDQLFLNGKDNYVG